MKDIKIEEALKLKNSIFIDVRSPEEFLNNTIPGSINIPLFTNKERAEIGTVYKEDSPEKARELGLQYVSTKLPQIISKIKKVVKARSAIVFCWRGGERSKSICSILDLMKIPTYRLEGGLKAYRQYILDKFKDFQLNSVGIVLHGYTGAGKTEILHRLAALGHPVLDLEGLAGHRGSAFGSVGIAEVRNQKQFDALLFNRLQELKNKPYILLEAESRRIGRVNMPDFLLDFKENGQPILVNVPIEIRTKRIIAEYAKDGISDELISYCHGSLKAIENRLIKRIGKKTFAQLEQALFQKDLSYVTRVLLNDYYDPLYKFSQDKFTPALTVDANNLENAVIQIDQFLKQNYD